MATRGGASGGASGGGPGGGGGLSGASNQNRINAGELLVLAVSKVSPAVSWPARCLTEGLWGEFLLRHQSGLGRPGRRHFGLAWPQEDGLQNKMRVLTMTLNLRLEPRLIYLCTRCEPLVQASNCGSPAMASPWSGWSSTLFSTSPSTSTKSDLIIPANS